MTAAPPSAAPPAARPPRRRRKAERTPEIVAAAIASFAENGYLWATVTYDDGTIQSYLDEVYGPGVVVVQSALRDLPAS